MKNIFISAALRFLSLVADRYTPPEMSISDIDDPSYFENAIKSQYFVDKTNLLKVFLHHQRPIKAENYAWDPETRAMLFTSPKGFGKTTNLDMVRRFFQVPFNKTTGEKIDKKTTPYYKLFASRFLSLEISKDQTFMDEHFGEYPILYLNFSNIQGTTDDKIITSIRKRIARVLNSYRWLCVKTRKEYENSTDHRFTPHLTYFKRIFKKTALTDDFVHALESLTELLAQHFGKKRVMVLIDDYDTPIIHAINNSIHAKPIYDFIDLLIKKFVQYEHVPCHIMITGASHSFFNGWQNTNLPAERSWIDTIQRNAFLRCPVQFAQYFGFTDKEVDRLLAKKSIARDERDKIKKHFNNYKSIILEQVKKIDLSLYHPEAVLRYLETNTIEDYHLNTDILMPQLIKCLHHEEFFKWVLKLRTKQTESLPFFIPSLFDSHLKDVQVIQNHCFQPPIRAIYETILFDNGYLSFAEKGIQLPNVMAENQLKRDMDKFFFDLYGIDVTNSYIKLSLRSILDSPDTTDEMSTNLANSLQHMINSGTAASLNKFQFLSIIFGTLINHWDSAQTSSITTQNQTLDRLTFRNDVQKITLVIQVVYNDTLENAINMIKDYHPCNERCALMKKLVINLNPMTNQVEVSKGQNTRCMVTNMSKQRA